MMDTNINIRLAGIQDIDKLTDLHCASFSPENHVPVMLGKRYVKATYKWLTSSPDTYGLVAELDGKIVGLITVCDKNYTRPMFIACLGDLILSIITRPTLLFQEKLWKRIFRHVSPSEKGKTISSCPGLAQIMIGAVDENYRGLSIFPTLVEATKSFSAARGSRGIQVGVYKTNAASRRVFSKGGWIETKELETPETVFYVAYIDPTFPKELGVVLPS